MYLLPSLRVIGILLLMLSSSMLASLAWSSYELLRLGLPEHYQVFKSILASITLSSCLSLLFIFFGKSNLNNLGRREAFFIVSCAWIFGAAIAALPFYFWSVFSEQHHHEFANFINCYFEAMSGLTTTGASILGQVENLPRGLLFWRAFIQWLGGLGIVVLFVAVMPMFAQANKKIFQAETSHIGRNQDTPSLQDMAQVLWLIYGSFTFFQILMMKLCEPQLSWFTCITFSFSTAATAGFSVLNESAGSLSMLSQWLIIFFMFFAGVNYSLYYQAIKGNPKVFIENTEFKVYSAVIVLAGLIIAVYLNSSNYLAMDKIEISNPNKLKSATDSFFQTVSILTTTGFSNVDSNTWPPVAIFILLLLMLIGGCSGSTGGGIKVIRFVSLYKMIRFQMERVYRPNIIRPVTIDGAPLTEPQKQAITIHILAIFGLTCLGSFALLIIEGAKLDIISAVSATLASVNNIGPGFELVGVSTNYGWMHPLSKTILAFLMAIGRLEVFTVLAMLARRFWQF